MKRDLTIYRGTKCMGWNMKTSHFNPKNFVVEAIEGYTQLIESGENKFVEIIAPQPIDGIISIRVLSNNSGKNAIMLINKEDIYLQQEMPFEQAIEMMSLFVVHKVVPALDNAIVMKNDLKIYREILKEISKILLIEEDLFKNFNKKINIKEFEDIEKVWKKLGYALELNQIACYIDWKSSSDEFLEKISNLVKIQTGIDISVDLIGLEGIKDWCLVVNNSLYDKVLVSMDMNSDGYYFLLISKDKYEKISTLSNSILQKIGYVE